MKRSPMRSGRRKHPADRDAALAWWIAVTHRKRCIVCNQKSKDMQGHHVIAQDVIKREFPFGAWWSDNARRFLPFGRTDVPDWYDGEKRSLEDLRWDVRNGVPVCPRCHQRHTDAVERIPVLKLPAAAFSFAQELGLQHRLGDRHYEPAAVLT